MALQGEVRPFDAVVVADTGWEGPDWDAHVVQLQQAHEAAGVPFYVVTAGDIRADALDAGRNFSSMPLFRGASMGSRQCTKQYKIVPVQRAAKRLLGIDHGREAQGRYIELAIGISYDEWHRAKDSRVKYVRHVFPLLDGRTTRTQCAEYLERVGWGSVGKSACVGCPLRSKAEWRFLRDERPGDFADAVAFDQAAQKLGRGSLHPSGDLASADLGGSVGQLGLFDHATTSTASCSPFACASDG